MKRFRIGPFLIIRKKDFDEATVDVLSSNAGIYGVKERIDKIFGSIEVAEMVLDRAESLASDFLEDKAKVEAKFCEWTGRLKTECHCGVHK